MLSRASLYSRSFRSFGILSALFGFVAIAGVSPPSSDAQEPHFVPGCNDQVHAQFDFWIGDWQVFDAESDELIGFDRIARIFDGCVVRQEWTQFNDAFRPEGGYGRLRGESLFSVMNDGLWRQTWVDNSGFSVALSGGPGEAADEIILLSDAVPYESPNGGYVSVYFRWHWRLLETGEVRSWGYTRVTDAGVWEPSFNNLYRRNR